MLKDLFSNRLFVGALAFFVLCVAGSLLYLQYVAREGAEYAAETQARVVQWNEKQKPTTAEVPEGDTSQGGHFHEDGTFHAEPHEPVAETPSLQENTDKYSRPGSEPATKAEYEAWRAQYKADMGVYPPPPGYYHWKDGDGVHLVKSGDPYVKIKTYIGFRPSPAQLETYQELLNQKVHAWRKGNRVEYDHIVKKIEDLRFSSPGEIPNIGGIAFIGIESDVANAKAQEKLKAAFEELGIGYLYGVPGLLPSHEGQPTIPLPFPEPK